MMRKKFPPAEEQKCRIIKVFETNFSLNGSDGGHGGCRASAITAICLGQEQAKNKSSTFSSLMPRSNALVKICWMFPLKAKEEFNYDIYLQLNLGIQFVS
jgi:hypothetical protein